MTNEKKQIVIIGGGITGLTAAFYLQKNNVDADITLIEASDQLGGKIDTITKEGFTIERGPDSFLERKTTASTLAEDLGIDGELVRSATGKAYILSEDRLHPMPKGGVMGVPTEIRPFIFSSLFTWKGKFTALKDFVVSKTKTEEDLSVGYFFRRRIGNEMVDRMIHPLISGIYAGDIDQLSLKATFPQFYAVEQKHKSLIRGLKKTTPKTQTSGKKKGMFLTLEGGLSRLVESLEAALVEPKIVTNTAVKHVEKHQQSKKYDVYFHGEKEKITADYVIATTPHHVTKKIFSQYNFMHDLSQTKNTSVANVAMAFKAEAIKNLPDGTGFVVTRKGNYRITACTWTHKKWPHTTPEGNVLLRAYVGKPGDEEVLDLEDQEIASLVLKDLRKIMHITEEPLFHVVTRWRDAMPQYTVGHLDRLQQLEDKLHERLPGVFLVGNAYRGVGLPDCMDQAIHAVDEITALQTAKST
ncbi:protoporphyrinogen oxidase [Halalkalibacillus halophilus]|uniref:protoporphyrinogen oxidase n=1 Tax=Halalkalibacillus halophilus TaxID=392827 RepID=UPI0003F7541B|nr:protoporphyrinogen oxidase [Halalkalibacillus halophilus]